jgi:hypothetical protein
MALSRRGKIDRHAGSDGDEDGGLDAAFSAAGATGPEDNDQ